MGRPAQAALLAAALAAGRWSRAAGANALQALDRAGPVQIPALEAAALRPPTEPPGGVAGAGAAEILADGGFGAGWAAPAAGGRRPLHGRAQAQIARKEFTGAGSSRVGDTAAGTSEVITHERGASRVALTLGAEFWWPLSATEAASWFLSPSSPTGTGTSPVACRIELVVARYDEDLSWLRDLAQSDMCVTVYNKGGKIMIPTGFQATREVTLPNVKSGNEGHSFLVHIISRYDALPEWTVFLQGKPEDHYPKIIDFLRGYDFSASPPLKCLTCQWNQHVPDFGGCKEKMEPRVFGIDPATAEVVRPVAFGDAGVQNFMTIEAKRRKVPPGKLLTSFCRAAGLPAPSGVMDFCYGAEFIVHRDRIRQHPHSVYESIYRQLVRSRHEPVDEQCTRCKARRWTGYLLERLWFHIFEAGAGTGKAAVSG